ncbi:glucan biosynthesis protein [Methylopila sp. M107]|uniref:glucan biosynthesis protein n=1 Tax=Methylopila sp. M107 TaxID=1101190 RepID=UPI00036D6390|nr:glucan biosynthesis protein [Methylopila sp. M107]
MNRRELLTGVAASALLATAARAQDQAKPPAPPDLLANDAPFSREALQDVARSLASRGYEEPKGFLPQAFADLPLDVYRSIQPKPERALWTNESRGFAVAPLPGGSIYRQPIRVGIVEDGKVRMLADDAGWFDFGRAPQLKPEDAFPLSGFVARAPIDKPDELRDFLAYQGATIFRALARGQIFGASSRGLAIDVAEQNGEEFPLFRALWIERPRQGSDALTVHGLLDSRRVAGAYRFIIRSGEITTVDVELTLFAREKLGHVGVAPMTSMFLFGPNDRIGFDDVRGEVHRSDGLQIWYGGGEWVWRPLANPSELQISVFGDNSPRGFGLYQRERGFRPYNDLTRRYDRMPSVWVQPIGDWGEGQLQLVEIPTDTDIHENIVAYWRPKAPIEPGKPFSMSYRMHWCWTPPDRAGGAFVVQTACGTAGGKRRRFVVDFQGDAVADPARAPSIRANVSTNVGEIRDVVGMANPDIKGYRVAFTLNPNDEELCELRLFLESDTGRIGETWLYRWTA